MPTTIKLKNSVTTTNAPSSLAQGEVAINITDKKVWVGNAATTPIQLVGDGGSASFTSIAFGLGTVSNPSITFIGDTNTGIYSPTADTIAFTGGGAETLRINSLGNVGIGTNAPTNKLSVNGGIGLPAATTETRGIEIGIGRAGNGYSYIDLIGDATYSDFGFRLARDAAGANAESTIIHKGTGALSLSCAEAGPLVIYTSNVERMRVSPTGLVGIGTSSPSGLLDIVGSTNGELQSRIRNTNSGSSARTVLLIGNDTNPGTAGIFLQSSTNTGDGGGANSLTIYMGLGAPITFMTSAAERMRITSTGNVGIGTTSPSGLLHIRQGASSGSSYYTNQLLVENNGVAAQAFFTPTASYAILSHGTPLDGDSASILFDGNSRYMAFRTVNGTERMRIDNSGRLLIGTTSAPSGASSDVNVYTAKYLAAHGFAARGGTTGSFSANLFNIQWTGTAQLWIDTTNIGTFAFTSDYRVKRNIQTQTDNAIERIMKLRPVKYQMANYGNLFKEGTEIKEGFIAHEVQEVIPSGADGVKDAENQIQSLRVDAILSVAVKAIQELKTELDSVKAELNQLKGA